MNNIILGVFEMLCSIFVKCLMQVKKKLFFFFFCTRMNISNYNIAEELQLSVVFVKVLRLCLIEIKMVL